MITAASVLVKKQDVIVNTILSRGDRLAGITRAVTPFALELVILTKAGGTTSGSCTYSSYVQISRTIGSTVGPPCAGIPGAADHLTLARADRVEGIDERRHLFGPADEGGES